MTQSHMLKKNKNSGDPLLPSSSGFSQWTLVGLFSDEKSTPQIDICCLVVRLLPGPRPTSRKPN